MAKNGNRSGKASAKPAEKPGLVTRMTVSGFKSIVKAQSIEIQPLTILAGANSSGKSAIMQPVLLLKQTLDSPYKPAGLLLDGPNVQIDKWERVTPRGQAAVGCDLRFRSEPGRKTSGYFLENLHRARMGPVLAHPASTHFIRTLIHLPGIRRSQGRLYPRAAVTGVLRGTFDNYAASFVLHWQLKNPARFASLQKAVRELGLTSRVEAREAGEDYIEILVARSTDESDLVSIADVGLGVAQSLPILVALLAAETSGTVYVEEPELHLHPAAQVRLAKLLAEAAQRGVRVIAETHSSLLLREVQTLVASGKLVPELVKLHWFTRDAKTGATLVTAADLDANGAFGEWPQDFGAVTLDSSRRYLDAVEERQAH